MGGVCVLVLIAAHGANSLTADVRMFHLDMEDNLPTWFTSSQHLMAALAAVLVARFGRDQRRLWLALALIMGLLSFEEIAQVHDQVEDRVNFNVAQLVLEPAVGLVVLAVFITLARRSERSVRRLLLAGAASLVLAHTMSALNGTLDLPHYGIVAASTLEETFEMLVGTLVLAASAAPALQAVRAELGSAVRPRREAEGAA